MKTYFLKIDPLRDEGEAYAAKLQASDVPATLKRYEGVTHEFFGMAPIIKESDETVARAVAELRKAFNPDQTER